MTTQHSNRLPSSACEELCDDSLQEISGGRSLIIGRVTGGSLTVKPSIGKIGGIRPFNCGACVQGLPGDLLKNPAINQAINPGFRRL